MFLYGKTTVIIARQFYFDKKTIIKLLDEIFEFRKKSLVSESIVKKNYNQSLDIIDFLYPKHDFPDDYDEENYRKLISGIILRLSIKEQKFLELYLEYKVDLSTIKTMIGIANPADYAIKLRFKIKKKLQNGKLGEFVNNSKKVSNLFERLSQYSKKDVISLIDSLDSNSLDLLRKGYGDNFDTPNFDNLDRYEKTRLNTLVNKMRKMLGEKNQAKEKLEDANVIDAEMELKKGDERMARKAKKLFERFPEHTEEEVRNFITNLNGESQDLLKLGYGENYDSLNIDALDPSVKKRLFNLVSWIKTKLDNQKKQIIHETEQVISLAGNNGINLMKQRLFEQFNEFSRDEIMQVINSDLSYEEREQLKSFYGDDFSKTLDISGKSKLIIVFLKGLLKKMQSILISNRNANIKIVFGTEENSSAQATIQQNNEIEENKPVISLDESTCNMVFNGLNDEDKKIIMLMYGFPRHHSFEEVANWLELSEERKISFVRNILIAYKELISQKVENSILVDDDEVIRMVQSNYSEEDKANIVFAFRYGLIGNGCKSCEEIATFLGYSIEEVINQIRVGLNNLKARYFVSLNRVLDDDEQILKLVHNEK